MNTALINGEIDAYFTGGTYTASPARFDGLTNIRGITPLRADGRQGRHRLDRADLGGEQPRPVFAGRGLPGIRAGARDFSKAVAFAEGTYNPVSQMGDPAVFDLFDSDELDAIQWDSLEEEMARSVEYKVVASYAELSTIYNAAKRG
jgi:spermidine/putrescine transport system substrate-binding protein